MSKVLAITSINDTTLYKELLRRNNTDTKAFVANIPSLCEEASDRSKQIPKFFAEYTLHDQTHFLRVTELMSYVVGDTLSSLNDIEIGILILAAFYHDQGMLIDEKEYKELESNEDFIVYRDNWVIDHGNYTEVKRQLEASFISEVEKVRLAEIIKELDSAMLTGYLRDTHGQRSHDYVISEFSKERALNVSGTNISSYLAKVCLSHVKPSEWIVNEGGLNYDENIGTFKVNTIFISLVLRLADILDFDSDRTPDVLFKSIHFTSSISIAEWRKHRNVNGWEINRDLVRFTMYFDHPAYERTAREFLDWIDIELSSAHSLIKKFPSTSSKYQINVAEKVSRDRLGPKNNSYLYHDLEFTLSRNEIVKLLMTDKLYKNPSLFIRELLQNSLDALRLRKAIYQKDNFTWQKGEISFRHYINSDGLQVIECTDNGCGMDESIVSKFLGKVGRSYYRSPEFERQRALLRDKGVDFEPCSQFGIGFMSCFMVGDRIEILTRRDYGSGKAHGKPLMLEINGLGGLIVIKEGSSNQSVGTTVRVFCRQKPLFFDDWSDNIRLVLTLKGYALATEFPIKANCEIKELKEEFEIPAVIDKKATFLEKLKIKKIKTFETSLSDVNKNLSGFLRQTFLIDDAGNPALENDEANWTTQTDDKTWRDQTQTIKGVVIKKSDTFKRYDFHRGIGDDISICLDGILVCGYPGRSEYEHFKMSMLGHISPRISSEHPFTVDIRGNIKPEINPAREPMDDRSFLSGPLGWSYAQTLISRGSGLLWKSILEHSETGLSPDVFWRLLLIYEGDFFYIQSALLKKHLHLPTDGGSWLKLSDVEAATITDKEILLTSNGKTNKFSMPDEMLTLGKAFVNAPNFHFWLSGLLLCLSRAELKSENPQFKIRESFSDVEVPADNSFTRELSPVRFIEFADLDESYLTTTKHNNIVNSKNKIASMVLSSRFAKHKNELQEFASSLVFNVCFMIQKLNDENKPFSLDYKLRSLKYTALLYLNINWSKYSSSLQAPYKIYVDSNSSIEITEQVFRKWAEQEIILE